jgi:hypothetical protein
MEKKSRERHIKPHVELVLNRKSSRLILIVRSDRQQFPLCSSSTKMPLSCRDGKYVPDVSQAESNVNLNNGIGELLNSLADYPQFQDFVRDAVEYGFFPVSRDRFYLHIPQINRGNLSARAERDRGARLHRHCYPTYEEG